LALGVLRLCGGLAGMLKLIFGVVAVVKLGAANVVAKSFAPMKSAGFYRRFSVAITRILT
jgi:hypothetical protein